MITEYRAGSTCPVNHYLTEEELLCLVETRSGVLSVSGF
jgi:hypothetical protein